MISLNKKEWFFQTSIPELFIYSARIKMNTIRYFFNQILYILKRYNQIYRFIDIGVRVFANGPVDQGSSDNVKIWIRIRKWWRLS